MTVAIATFKPLGRRVLEAAAIEVEAVLINHRFRDRETVENELSGRAGPKPARNVPFAGIPLETNKFAAGHSEVSDMAVFDHSTGYARAAFYGRAKDEPAGDKLAGDEWTINDRAADNKAVSDKAVRDLGIRDGRIDGQDGLQARVENAGRLTKLGIAIDKGMRASF